MHARGAGKRTFIRELFTTTHMWMLTKVVTGAHGTFTSYGDYSNITAASFLGAQGKQTPVFVRFSTVAGSRGSADTARDVHGFATRFVYACALLHPRILQHKGPADLCFVDSTQMREILVHRPAYLPQLNKTNKARHCW